MNSETKETFISSCVFYVKLPINTQECPRKTVDFQCCE